MGNQPKNQKAHLVTPIPGPKSQILRARETEILAPGLQNFAVLAGISIESGRGSCVTDVDGNTFLDIIGAIGVNGLGYAHPKYIERISRQLAQISVGSFTTKARVDFLEKMSKYFPFGEDYQLQLYSSGAEAVESALRLAKSYTKKSEFIGFWGGFHGKTMGALSLMGSDFKNGYGPLVSGNHLVAYADCTRCPVQLSFPQCEIRCLDLIESQIEMASGGKIAAIVVEPMQGTAGNLIPPPDFLPAIRKMADDLGALLIVDEMITGFGRTGKFWACEHTHVIPDIVTIGKQLGGGFPVSGVIAKRKIACAKPWSLPSGSSSSYGGNPLACAAALAVLDIIEEEGLVENSRDVGDYFLAKIKPMQSRYSFIDNVRGQGLFLGMDFMEDKETKRPLSKEKTQRIFSECLGRGLLTMGYAPRFRIQPALTIDKATVDNIVAILTQAFDAFENEEIKAHSPRAFEKSGDTQHYPNLMS